LFSLVYVLAQIPSLSRFLLPVTARDDGGVVVEMGYSSVPDTMAIQCLRLVSVNTSLS